VIELGKKYQTSDGRKIRILAIDTDPSDAFPVIGFCYSPRANGSEYLQRWSRHGAALYKEEDDTCDLVPIPTKHQGWMVICQKCPPNGNRVYVDRILADIACGMFMGEHVVPVTWED